MTKSTISIKVPKKQGEKAIALANKLGLMDKSLEIQRDESSLCIPLLRLPDENELVTLKSEVPETELSSNVFAEKRAAAQSLLQVLEKDLPSDLLASLPQALDVIGDIAVIEIPQQLKGYENLFGEAILKTHRNVRTVLAKAGAIGGIFRLREFTFIAGEHKTQTVHKEFGCQYHVDVAKAYFSPRLSHEHQRVASHVQSGEVVVDLFAGVEPFSVLIAKENPTVKVYAVDINPDAVELLKVNTRVKLG